MPFLLLVMRIFSYLLTFDDIWHLSKTYCFWYARHCARPVMGHSDLYLPNAYSLEREAGRNNSVTHQFITTVVHKHVYHGDLTESGNSAEASLSLGSFTWDLEEKQESGQEEKETPFWAEGKSVQRPSGSPQTLLFWSVASWEAGSDRWSLLCLDRAMRSYWKVWIRSVKYSNIVISKFWLQYRKYDRVE